MSIHVVNNYMSSNDIHIRSQFVVMHCTSVKHHTQLHVYTSLVHVHDEVLTPACNKFLVGAHIHVWMVYKYMCIYRIVLLSWGEEVLLSFVLQKLFVGQILAQGHTSQSLVPKLYCKAQADRYTCTLNLKCLNTLCIWSQMWKSLRSILVVVYFTHVHSFWEVASYLCILAIYMYT